MRRIALALLIALAATGADAQGAPGGETRVLTFAIAPPPPPPVVVVQAPASGDTAAPPGGWIVSETRSPVDYAPVAIATSVAATDEAPRLSIQCRGGQTEMLVLLSTAATGREAVSVALDDEPPRPLRIGPSAAQNGVALRDAPQRFLASLPARGTLRVRVSVAGQPDLESRVALATLSTVLQRLAQPCGWSATTRRAPSPEDKP